MVLVASVREILTNNEHATASDISEMLSIELEAAEDILKELRRT